MKNKVSGHSGLPEDVELRILVEKAEENRSRRESRYQEILAKMNSLGIAPTERRKFIIGFVKWLEKEKAEK